LGRALGWFAQRFLARSARSDRYASHNGYKILVRSRITVEGLPSQFVAFSMNFGAGGDQTGTLPDDLTDWPGRLNLGAVIE
jgi:hypothetical protein